MANPAIVYLADERLERQRRDGTAPSSLRHAIAEDGSLVVEQLNRFGYVVETYRADVETTEHLLVHLIRTMAGTRAKKVTSPRKRRRSR